MLETLVPVVLLAAGAGLLTVGAEAFVEHLADAAARLRVSVLGLGLLLAGAEPEEAVTAIVASAQGHPSLAAGDAVGANLVILTLALGLAALLTPLPVGRRVVQYAGAAAAAGLLATVFLWNGVLGRVEATALVLLYVAGVVWVWRREQAPPMIGELAELAELAERGEPAERGEAGMAVPDVGRDGTPGGSGRPLGMIMLGLMGMVTGGFLAVQGAAVLVGTFGLSESVVGLTVLALATSAEMVTLVLAARRRGMTEVAVAGALGSVGYNATVSLGLAAWAAPLTLGRGTPIVAVGVATAALPLVLLAGRRTGVFPRPLGLVLAVGYLGATIWLLGG